MSIPASLKTNLWTRINVPVTFLTVPKEKISETVSRPFSAWRLALSNQSFGVSCHRDWDGSMVIANGGTAPEDVLLP